MSSPENKADSPQVPESLTQQDSSALVSNTTIFYNVVQHIGCICSCNAFKSAPNLEQVDQVSTPEEPQHGFFHPSRQFYQYTVLLLVAYLLVAGYFADETIGATTTALKKEYNLSTTEIGWLYSSGFGPTIITIFISGFVVDRFGVKSTSLLFSSIVMVGIVVFAVSPSYVGKLIGRIIFGLGFEPLEVCQDAILVRWFGGQKRRGPSLPFSFAICFALSIFGQFLGLNVIPMLHAYVGDLNKVYYVVAILCVTGWVSNVVYVLMDINASAELKLDSHQEHDVVTPLAIKQFPISFWLLMAISFFGYSCQYVFMIFASDYMHEKWGYQPINASHMASLVYLLGMLIAPLVGFFIEKKGHATSFMGCGLIIFAVSSIMMMLLPPEFSPLLPLLLMGVAYAAVPASIWSVVASIIPEHLSGTAYGTLTAFISLSLVVVPFCVGRIRDTFGSYEPMHLLFTFCGILSFVGVIVLCKYTDMLPAPTHEPLKELEVV